MKGFCLPHLYFCFLSLCRNKDLQRPEETPEARWPRRGQTQIHGPACEQPPRLYFQVKWVQHHLKGIVSAGVSQRSTDSGADIMDRKKSTHELCREQDKQWDRHCQAGLHEGQVALLTVEA